MSTDETRRRLARKLREELGELICAALDDPKVIEILLNCDGALFIERLGEPMTKVCDGFDPKQAEAIIGTIASSLSPRSNGRAQGPSRSRYLAHHTTRPP